jgi:two-component system phosphate regulon response regulator PhoB
MTTDKILIVDDHAELRALIRLTLAPLRATLLEAPDTTIAWQIVEQHRPHVVVLDVNLTKNRDGLELCRRIKRTPASSGIAVVLLTTAAQVEDVQLGKEAGAAAYLTKPFSPAHLLEVVRGLGA